MSWLYCLISSDQGAPLPNPVHSKPLYKFRTARFYLAVGGIPETCFFEETEYQQAGWAAVGLGIRVRGTTCKLLGREDWRKILSSGMLRNSSLDGHFAVVTWKGEDTEFYTDELGLRTLYYAKSDLGTCISTRLDWVTRTTGNREIDFASFGSKWLMFNQLKHDSCLVSVGRLGPKGHLLIRNGREIMSESLDWVPEFKKGKSEEASTMLSTLLRGALDSGRTVSLGLSGGMDSRFLLAMLMGIENRPFEVHTFGDAADPDVKVSSNIANRLGIKRTHFDEPLPDPETTISWCREFAAQACLVEPVSSFLKLRYYPQLRHQNKLMIDGGFGEIARRQYLNRVVKLGWPALLRGDVNRLFSLMVVHRGDFFDHEVLEVMKSGARESLERLLAGLPPVRTIGVGNLADLLAVRTRVPNYGGPEQARIDGEVINFMPFAQPSFLRTVFATETRLRSNGRFFRDCVHEKCPALETFPLVKSGMTYGFGLSTLATWIQGRVKSKFGHSFRDPAPAYLLKHAREFVLDLAHSNNVAQLSFYDVKKIHGFVDAYFERGDKSVEATVNWWLTFELWRRSLID